MLAVDSTPPRRESGPYCSVGNTMSGPTTVPVWAQKSRSAMEEERNAAGLPRVQAKSPRSMSAKEANGAPDAFWHIRQWQMLTLVGGADSAKRMAPHWQPPVRTGLAAVMSSPQTDAP